MRSDSSTAIEPQRAVAPSPRASDVRRDEPYRYAAYICLRVAPRQRREVADLPVAEIAARLGLKNEFETLSGHPADAFAHLRRVEGAAGDIVDDGVLQADVLVHVASAHEKLVSRFCDGLAKLLPPGVGVRVLECVSRPTRYTGNEVHNLAYAEQLLQQPGAAAPNGFLLPMNKTSEWWAKDVLERHTYFLPRYDEAGRMVAEGHVLAAVPGVSTLARRTYKNACEPAPADQYDFVNYFESSDEDVPIYHQVCAALRDTTRNPEWSFVREGPSWHGRRTATWGELFV